MSRSNHFPKLSPETPYPLIGIYGGTFDPVHYGHINPVSSVAEQSNLKRVLFIPSAIPPHRPQPVASAEDRLKMAQIAVSGYPRFRVDDRELRRNNPSYMIDTVLSLKAENPHQYYCLILGMDALLGLENWYQWEALFNHVHFIVMQRPGWSQSTPLPAWWQAREARTFSQLQQSKAGRIHLIKTDLIDISATEIRNRLKSDKDVSKLIPQGVYQYIRNNQLYE
ncbi:MAG: nicotinate-nucleotide adenylyltransferase [Gammaproteobacteria bacterium]|nr:nicotinate-nucleotide adenylyltransferase [Gammaproteobacteria bacterium]